jgi:cytochrome c oxidase subunit 2
VACAALTVAFAGASSADDNARGEALYDLCQQCHGVDGGGSQLALAPAIAGLEQWYVEAQLKNFRSGLRGLHAQDLAGLRMYPMSLTLASEDDVSAVAKYVASMPAVAQARTVEGGDAAKGAESYKVCVNCHGDKGDGNKTLNSPPLRGMSDWYLLTTLRKFREGVRGTNPKNPNEMLMRGMSLSLTDDQAIKDVIAHIQTFN